MKVLLIMLIGLALVLVLVNQFVDRTIHSEILIDASVQEVWDEFYDFDSYANWNPFLKSITGDAQVGKTITVSIEAPGMKAMEFKPEVLANQSPKEFRWIGKLFIKGIADGEHHFILEPTDDGKTLFVQGENFTGILSGVFMKMVGKSTIIGFNAMNEGLKARVEAQRNQ